jgi:glutathione S-transferase
MLALYAIEGCPFAQRTRALLTRLNEPFDLRAVDPGNKSSEFLHVSPNGRTPLLVDGDARLYESFVVNEYLAEKLRWRRAHSTNAAQRGRERLAMLQFDQVLLPELFGSERTGELPAPARLNVVRHLLADLEETTKAAGGCDNLLGIHCAVHWARIRWRAEMRPAPLVPVVAAHPALVAWLDTAAQHPAVQATLPPKAVVLARA